jgi:hypothetical protein
MTFDIAQIQDGMAQTHKVDEDGQSYHIIFDPDFIVDNGVEIVNGDNIGYDWSKVQTNEEALVVFLTHEAIHYRMMTIIDEACRATDNYNNIFNDAVNYLLNDRGQSQEFVDIYFVKNEGGNWVARDPDKAQDEAHKYMNKYYHQEIDKALEEYRNEY